MKVVTFGGRECIWKLMGKVPFEDDTRPRSALHKSVRAFLKKNFPLERILEELRIPGEKLYLDFFMPSRMMAIEAQGRQHTEYVQHFHRNKLGFIAARKRDQKKREWLALNDITLLCLDYNDDEQRWTEQLAAATGR